VFRGSAKKNVPSGFWEEASPQRQWMPHTQQTSVFH
jgi:hypothetical protein